MSNSRRVVLVVPALAMLMLVSALATPAEAGQSDAELETGPDDPLAVEWLRRAMVASDRVSYRGTQYVAAWSAVDDGASTSALLDVTSTVGRPVDVRLHGRGERSVADPGSRATWLAGAGGPTGLLVQAYDVALAGAGRVAGRTTTIIEARGADGTAAARLWLDDEYALPLRREVYGDDGSVVSASAFIEIEVGERPRWDPVRSTAVPLGVPARSSEPLQHADLARLRADGWDCPGRLANGLVLYEATRLDDVVQLSYSDGVVTMSVFEQPGQLDPTRLEGFAVRQADGGAIYSKPGPPSQFTWSTGDMVVTVVADAPGSAVDAVLSAFPPAGSASHSLWDRIERGGQRVLAWLNPFD